MLLSIPYGLTSYGNLALNKIEAPNREKRESGIRMEVRNRSKVTDEDGFKRREEK